MKNTRDEYLDVYDDICNYLVENRRKSKAMDLLEDAHEVIENAVYDLDDSERYIGWMRDEKARLEKQIKDLTAALKQGNVK